jgi:hypothetical protein
MSDSTTGVLEKSSLTADRQSITDWVDIADMRVSQAAQREFRLAHAAKLAVEFDMEAFGYPIVNIRDDGSVYLVDGQHRVAALKMTKRPIDKVLCEIYHGLTEEEEAELFLLRDTRRAIPAFERWKIAQTAGRKAELEIARIVNEAGLKVAMSTTDGAIRAVGTLKRIYDDKGENVLARTLAVIRDAFGTNGFDAIVMTGISMMISRYGDKIDDDYLTQKLGRLHGGVRGLVGNAEVLHRQTGHPKSTCVAAAAVEAFNSGHGGYRLTPWWRQRNRESVRIKKATTA